MDIPKQLDFLPAFSVDAEKMSAAIKKKKNKKTKNYILKVKNKLNPSLKTQHG